MYSLYGSLFQVACFGGFAGEKLPVMALGYCVGMGIGVYLTLSVLMPVLVINCMVV